MLKNEKVEWKKLGDVCEFKNGYAFKSNSFKTNGVPIIRITNINKGKIHFEDLKYINLNDYPDLNDFIVEHGDILVAMSGATTGKIGYNYTNKKAYLNQRVGKIVPNKALLNNRYLYHFLYSNENYIFSLASGSGSQPNLSKSDVEKIEIPVPSLKTQEKIVNYLDEFINYLTELQSELQSRNKQYEYYRDKLLSEEHLNKLINNSDLYKNKYELRKAMMKDVCEIKRGRVMSKQYLEENIGDYPVYSSQTLNNGQIGSIKTYDFDGEYITWTTDGAYAGTVFYRNEKFSVTNVCGIMKNKDEKELLLKYMYYYLQIETKKHVKSGSGNPKLMSNVMEQIKIIYPPIEIQEKIVEILDKFQALTQDVSGLLPDEIEKREKQYEYYREKLLTFDTECTSGGGGYHLLSKDYISLLTQAGALVGVKVFELEYVLLKDISVYSSDKIDVTELNEENYVGVDNLLKDKLGKVNSNNLPKSGNVNLFSESDILLGNIRPYLRKIWLADIDGGASPDVLVISLKEDEKNKVLAKYLYYVLSSEEFFEYDIKFSRGAKMPRGNKSKIMDYKILIPPKSIQEYIVSILDKFEALSQSTTEGLRREIELREKQYEYYREKLLTFEK